MMNAIEEYKWHEQQMHKCIKCNSSVSVTKLFRVKGQAEKDDEDKGSYICIKCAKIADNFINTTADAKKCIECEVYKARWAFIEYNQNNNDYEEKNMCLDCRRYEESIKTLLDNDRVKCDICKDSFTKKNIFKSEDHYMCKKCIENKYECKECSAEKSGIEYLKLIKNIIKEEVNGTECNTCKCRFPKWYINKGSCCRCKFIDYIKSSLVDEKDSYFDSIMYKNSSELRNKNRFDVFEDVESKYSENSSDSRSVSRSDHTSDYLESKYNLEHHIHYLPGSLPSSETSSSKSTYQCSKDVGTKTLLKDNTSFSNYSHELAKRMQNVQLKDYSNDSDSNKSDREKDQDSLVGEFPYHCELVIDLNNCINNQMEEKKMDEEEMYNEFIKQKSIKVKCINCKNEDIPKTSAYGSVRDGFAIEYEKDNKYLCFECAYNIYSEQKREGKEVFFKRVFDDETIYGKYCKKCRTTYPRWHFFKNNERKPTETCLECRARMILTKYNMKVKNIQKKVLEIN